jgi:hypothetical protein
MKTPPTLTNSTPPKLIPTLLSGFNIVASNIFLIVLPILVDLALWLGPKIKLESLLLPQLTNLNTKLLNLEGPDLKSTLDASQQMWTQILSNFNLEVTLRTFPIGIPSLVSREMFIDSPLGNGKPYQVPSFGIAFLLLFAFLLVGFFLGNYFFNMLSRYTAKPIEKISFNKLMAQFGQSLVMALILLIIILILLIPILLVLSLISIASGSIADFILLIAIFVMLWMILPLVFSPHGVYVINQKAFPSMLLSIRMIRFFLPGTGMFVVTAALISEGMNLVWTIPGSSSWLTLISIFGHAFIVTALLTASFIYYREGLRWMQEAIQHMSAPMSTSGNGGPFGTTRQ